MKRFKQIELDSIYMVFMMLLAALCCFCWFRLVYCNQSMVPAAPKPGTVFTNDQKGEIIYFSYPSSDFPRHPNDARPRNKLESGLWAELIYRPIE